MLQEKTHKGLKLVQILSNSKPVPPNEQNDTVTPMVFTDVAEVT
jgi:hypothetical protein